MHYQPLISLKDGEFVGFEALLRWHHPVKGFISPAAIYSDCRRFGVDNSDHEMDFARNLPANFRMAEAFARYKNLFVSVNISGKHLTDEDLVADVQKALKISNLSPASSKT